MGPPERKQQRRPQGSALSSSGVRTLSTQDDGLEKKQVPAPLPQSVLPCEIAGDLPYLLPILLSWICSIPIAVWTGSPALGDRLIRFGLFPDCLTAGETRLLEPLIPAKWGTGARMETTDHRRVRKEAAASVAQGGGKYSPAPPPKLAVVRS